MYFKGISIFDSDFIITESCSVDSYFKKLEFARIVLCLFVCLFVRV